MTDTRDTELDEAGTRPYRRAGLWRRIGPFAAVAVAAEASVTLPPGPVSTLDTVLSVALLAAAAAAIVLLPWRRLPAWASAFVPLTYVGSVLFLVLAAGGSTAGIGTVVLIPLVWTAMYQQRWESALVVLAIVALQLVTSLVPTHLETASIVRRAALWAVLGSAVSTSIHGLRDRLRLAFASRERLHRARSESLRRATALQAAGAELAALLDPDAVTTTATRLAAELVSPSSDGLRRAQYLRVEHATVHVAAVYDETLAVLDGPSTLHSFPLAEHPVLARVVDTRAATHGPIDFAALGPHVGPRLAELGIRHSLYVPVVIGDELDGVLTVSIRDRAVSEEVFAQCKALGHLTELALRNAVAHADVQALATTDALTGVANRRAFEQMMTERPGRGAFTVVAVDIDGLKALNDSQGHDAGDRLLVAVAGALQRALRRGDLLARIGGDEFAMLCFDADLEAGRQIARRALEALAATLVGGTTPRASLGVAAGGQHDDSFAVLRAADEAMYEAKRLGGGRLAVAAPALHQRAR